MGQFKLTEGWESIPVGEDKTLLMKKVFHDEEFDKVRITFEDPKGATLTEYYALVTKDNKPNKVALGILSNIYMSLFDGEYGDVVDPEALEGHKVVCDVYEEEYNGKKYSHVRNFRPADDDSSDDGEVEPYDDDGLFD